MEENKNIISFEQALLRLEEIVRKLESGNAPLDDSIKLYEEGVELVRIASSRLNEAKSKITVIDPRGENNE